MRNEILNFEKTNYLNMKQVNWLLKIGQVSAELLLSLINDILDLGWIESQRFDLDIEQVDFDSIKERLEYLYTF